MGKLVPVTIQLTTGRSAIFGSRAVIRSLRHMSYVYIPQCVSSSSLSTLLCWALCLSAVRVSRWLASDGLGRTRRRCQLLSLAWVHWWPGSVSCVVPPVSSCPLTVRDWESRVTVCVTQPAAASRGRQWFQRQLRLAVTLNTTITPCSALWESEDGPALGWDLQVGY